MLLTEKEAIRLINRGVALDDPAIAENVDSALNMLNEELRREGPEYYPLLEDKPQLVRFLFARKLRIEPTIQMIKAHVEWRKNNLPVQLTDLVLAELKKCKTFRRGEDVKGRPLIVIQSRNFDPKTRDLDASIAAYVHQLEEAVALLKPEQEQFAMLYDRTGFRLRNLDLDVISKAVKTLSDNYPERLGAAYVYPAGPVAYAVFKLVSPFMDARTANKVEFIKNTAQLEKFLPHAVIPLEYGGGGEDNTSIKFDTLEVSPPTAAA